MTSEAVYELDRQGRLLNVVSIAAGTPKSAAGITLAPPSDGSSGLNLYVVDRGVDNDSNPNENDGRFYEMALTLPPLGDSTNRAPQVSAGPDRAMNQSTSAFLKGTVSDDGLPDPPGTVAVTWSEVSGPGTVVFANPNAPTTTATFTEAGTYVLRLAADDGDMAVHDSTTVVVSEAPPGGGAAFDAPVGAGTDDAEERSATTSVTGKDLEFVVDGTTVQTVGLRFPDVAVPPGGTVTRAYVQFSVDEATTGETSLTVAGQAADDPDGFTVARHDISSRPRTAATVGWTPVAWPSVGARGADQRTADLTPVVQEIVDRAGWALGNALVLVITGNGTRTAMAWERGPDKEPVLHIELAPPGSGPANVAPAVSAGPDLAVTLPEAVSLAGSVSDDGLPVPPGAATAAWTTVSGPGPVVFADAAAASTTATFGVAGEYVLRLTGDDSALQAVDEVTVTVADETPANVAPAVSAGPDLAVTLPEAVSLAGSVSDDGLPVPPGAATAAWTTVSGPGPVVFADAAAASTTATFGVAGEYVLRLTGDDSALQAVDEVTVTVTGVLDVPVAAGTDDAEERSASVSLTGTDLELVLDGATVQTVGLRFAGVAVPTGATITRAYVQFGVDEASTVPTSLTVAGQAADNPSGFTAVSKNVSSRPRTTATVGWAPPRLADARGARGRSADAGPVRGRPGDRLPTGLGRRERGRAGHHRQRNANRRRIRARRGRGARPPHRIPNVIGTSAGNIHQQAYSASCRCRSTFLHEPVSDDPENAIGD